MAIIPTAGTRFDDTVYADRLLRAIAEAAARGIGALLITPSADYEYLLGYRPPAMERLTCLILPVDGEPGLVVPRLEVPLARNAIGGLADGIQIMAWEETDDPFRLVKARLPGALRFGLQDQMWSRFVLRLRALLDPAELVDAGPAIGAVRRIKEPQEVDRLRAAAAAADEAMAAMSAERL
jgi:Xaa-Pro aminopeptidase